ncbi:MAG: hypothetical protein AB1401_00500 [Thermodesulfobacteriota bacterium]
MSFGSLLNMKGTITRYTVTYPEDKMGAATKTPTPTVIATDVPCTIQPKSGRLRAIEYGQTLQAMYIGFFLIGTDLQEADEVEVNSVVYKVKFVSDAAGRSHHIEADLSR